MSVQLDLKPKNELLYVPEKATITQIKQFTEKEMFFALEIDSGRSLNHDPGQFVQVSVLGIGEAPISISSPPDASNRFELCVRAVGDLTNKLHTLQVGDSLFIRGPFGHGFTSAIQKRMEGKQLLFIAGGIGYVPLRSLINKVLAETEKYEKITILYGCKTPADRMYTDELEKIATQGGGKVTLLETVDKGDGSWKSNVGVITTLIPQVEIDPDQTIAVIVGPPIMYKFVLIKLMDRKIPKENVYMSLERRMKCGVGKCGHCKMEGIYVCQEGPVFNYSDVEYNEEVF